MSSLSERLKAKQAKETTVTVDGDDYLIRSISRTDKANLIERCTNKKGVVDSSRFEAEYLAACVFDPESQQPVEPDWSGWNVPSYISDPLCEAVMVINGIKPTKVDIAKNSVATES
jgi:hypothetical protein